MPSWSLLHHDDFSGGTSEIDGSTMSDGVGAWTVRGGTGIVSRSSGTAVSAAGSWSQVPYYDSVMPGTTGDQAAEVTFTDAGASGGPVTRWDGSNFYYASRGASSTTLYYGAGSYPGTSLGSWSHSPTSTDVLRLESVGSTHEVFMNGSSLGSVSDSAVATGRCGVWQAFSQNVGDFKDYTVASTDSARPLVNGGIASRVNLLGGLVR